MDLKLRLEMFDQLIGLDINFCLSGFALKLFMDRLFHGYEKVEEQREDFHTNIANCYPYSANVAYIERLLVKVGDHIDEEFKKKPNLDLHVPHRWDLKNIRDFIRHPGRVKFDNESLQKFVDNNGYYKQPKSIFLWNARRGILEELDKLGSERSKKWPPQVPLLKGMDDAVLSALKITLKPGNTRPDIAAITIAMGHFFSGYEEKLRKEVDRQYVIKTRALVP